MGWWDWIREKLFNNSGKICVTSGVMAVTAVAAPVIGLISAGVAAGAATISGVTSLFSGMSYAKKIERQNTEKDIEKAVTAAKDQVVSAQIEAKASKDAQIKALEALALLVSENHQKAITAKETQLADVEAIKVVKIKELADEKAAKELLIKDLADEKSKYEKLVTEKADNDLKAQQALDEKSEELKVANQKLSAKESEFIAALQKLTEKEETQSKLQEKVDTQLKDIASLNAQLSKLKVIHGNNDTAVTAARFEIDQLNLELKVKAGELEEAKKKLSESKQVIVNAQQEIKTKTKELALVEAAKELKVKELAEEKVVNELKAQQAQKVIEEKSNEIKTVSQKLVSKESEITEFRKKLEERQEACNKLAERLAKQLKDLDAVKEELRVEKLNSSTAQGFNAEALEAARSKLLKLDKELEMKTQEVEVTKASLAKAKQELIKTQNTLGVKTDELEIAAQKIKEGDSARLNLKAQLEQLEKDLAQNGEIIQELTAENKKARGDLQTLKEEKAAQVTVKAAEVKSAQMPAKAAEVKSAQVPAKSAEVKSAQVTAKAAEAKPAQPVGKPLAAESTEVKAPAAVTKRSDSFFGKSAVSPVKSNDSAKAATSPVSKGSAEKPKVLLEKFNKLTAEGKKQEAINLKDAYQCYEQAWSLEVTAEIAEAYKYMNHRGKTALLIRMLFISLRRLDEFTENGKVRKGIDSRELDSVIQHAKSDLKTLIYCGDLEVEKLEMVKGVQNLQIVLAILCNDDEGPIIIFNLYKRFKRAGSGSDFEPFFQFEKIYNVIQAMKAAARGVASAEPPPIEQSLTQESMCSKPVTELAQCSPMPPMPPMPPKPYLTADRNEQSKTVVQPVPASSNEGESDNIFASGRANLKKAPMTTKPAVQGAPDSVSVLSSALAAILTRRKAVDGDSESSSDNEFAP